MASHRAVTAILLGASLLCGCRTAPAPAPATIAVSPGLTTQQIEVAILAGILNTPPPASYDPAVELPPEEFARVIWRGFVADARSRSWFPESRGEGVVYAAVNTRGHYLRAAIRHDPSAVTVELVESRNLQEDGGRIHKRAVKWLSNLEIHIRRELGRMAAASMRGS